MRSSGSLARVRRLNSVARAMWKRVERTDDQPGTGSATYCSAVSLRQASKSLKLAQRSYANKATMSSCMNKLHSRRADGRRKTGRLGERRSGSAVGFRQEILKQNRVVGAPLGIA